MLTRYLMAFSLLLTADKNCTFVKSMTYYQDYPNLVTVDLSGCTAKMDIRGITSNNLILTLTTSNGRISLGGTAGTITLTISASDMATISSGNYVYDLLITFSGGTITRLVEGTFTVQDTITQ